MVASLGVSTSPISSAGPSTPPSDSSGPSRNAECTNCKLLRRKIKLSRHTRCGPTSLDGRNIQEAIDNRLMHVDILKRAAGLLNYTKAGRTDLLPLGQPDSRLDPLDPLFFSQPALYPMTCPSLFVSRALAVKQMQVNRINEVRAPRNQENRGREINRRTVIVENPTENALVAQDGIGGYNWSYQAEEEHPTNFALMAHTSSGSSSSSDSEVDSYSKSHLESVEARLAHYKKNEAVFEESINVLNLKVKLRDNALIENKKKLEKVEKERVELKLTLEQLQNSSKSLINLIESQVVDKFKTGLGYNAASSTAASPAVESFVNTSKMLENQEQNKSKSNKGYHTVPPPFTGNFIPFKPDLTFMDKIVKSENMDVTTIVTPSNVKKVESNHKSAGVKSNGDAVEPKTVRKNSFRPPVIEDWNSDDESEVEIIPKDKTVSSSTEKIKFVKSARETVEKVETSKQNKHYPRGNQRNWNNLMSQRLGSDFKMINKACFICGSFEHLHYVCDKKVIRPVWNNSSRVNHKNFANKMTHPHPNRRFVPQAVLTRSGKINTAGVNVNTAVRPVNTLWGGGVVLAQKIYESHSTISNAFKKGYSQDTRPFNKYSANQNSIFNKKVNTVRVKDTTARDRAIGNPQQKEYKEKGVIYSGCSRHMTGNKCYLTIYEDYDGGFVSFGDGKGRISRKGKIKIGTLDFDNLLDESQVLLRVPRKDNIYSVDLKSVVPTKGLTCLFAKAIIDESNLWHRRLGHINFKNINKLVKGNLAARTMLVDSKLPTTFWAEAVNTTCYVLNRVLVIKPHNKTLYELVCGRTPLIDFIKPFGCPVTILNTMDHLGKFDGKADEGFFVVYSVVSKAIRVFNKRTRIVEETLNIRFLENTHNLTGNGPDWLFDVDFLTISMNYVPVVVGNQTNGIARTRDNIVTDPKVSKEDAEEKPTKMDVSGALDKDGKDDQATRSEFERLLQQEKQSIHPNNTNSINTVSTPVSAAGLSFTNDDPSSPVNVAKASNAFEEHLFERFYPFKNAFSLPLASNVTPIDDTGIFGNAYDDEDVGADADLNNLETTMNVNPIPTTRIDKDHPKAQIIRDFNLTIQTRRMTKISDEHAMVCYINKQTRTNHKDYHNCLFACFLSQMEPKKVIHTLEDPIWIKAMQEELLQFQLQKVWTLVNLPNEGIDYDEVFAPVARIEAIRLFLAYASFMGFIVYQMDVKSVFLYGTIKEEVYVCQPPCYEDPQFPNKVYKVEKALYGLHQAPRAWYETLSTYLIENGFRRGTIDKTLFIKKDKGNILLVQVYVDDIIFRSTKKSLCDKFEDIYVANILKKFDFATVKTTSTPIEPNKALIKDEEVDTVNVHLYRLIIRSLMYLTASRPDIMFAVCACARFQVTSKMSHLHAVKRIFRYLKGQPKLGLWYPRVSPFDLEAFSNSDYAGAILDKKSTKGGCQFLGAIDSKSNA
ncbi:putative ribonuclease H-like domain-containing protein [Tanacetum coccineum]